MLLKRAGNLTLIPACEKSSKYGENEQVFSDTRKSGCCHNIGLRNCTLGGTHYCCDRQWKREWVGGCQTSQAKIQAVCSGTVDGVPAGTAGS